MKHLKRYDNAVLDQRNFGAHQSNAGRWVIGKYAIGRVKGASHGGRLDCRSQFLCVSVGVEHPSCGKMHYTEHYAVEECLIIVIIIFTAGRYMARHLLCMHMVVFWNQASRGWMIDFSALMLMPMTVSELKKIVLQQRSPNVTRFGLTRIVDMHIHTPINELDFSLGGRCGTFSSKQGFVGIDRQGGIIRGGCSSWMRCDAFSPRIVAKTSDRAIQD